MRLFSSRRRTFALVFGAASLLILGAGALYSRLPAQPSTEIRDIAPGLSLMAVNTQTPNGPLKFWLVKGDSKLFSMGLEVADSTNVVKKRSVHALAAQSNALVAVNGGFFAYGGAAVGAVKVGGQWQRLPWKNRTALGWSANNAFIGPLQGQLEITLDRSNVSDAERLRGAAPVKSLAALNGFTMPGERTAIVNGFSLLSAQFKPVYTLQPGETAAAISNVKPDNHFYTGGEPVRLFGRQRRQGKVTAFYADGAQIPLNAQDYLLVARGTMAPLLAPGPDAPDKMRFEISYEPAQWDVFPTIIGAGPRLLANGQVQTSEVAEEFQPDVIARGPRTAVGWDKNKNWLLLVADGRQAASVGLTLPETAVLFQQLGAVEAMNLDGGSSTQLVVGGELINVPSGFDPANPTRPREVQVSNALTLGAGRGGLGPS